VIEGEDKEIVMRILESITDKSYLEGVQTEKMWVPDVPEGEVSNGYKGRIGLFEGILADENVEKALQDNPGERDIWEAAKGQGILNMKQDGVIKVLKGITTLEEVRRVIDLDE